MLTFLHRHLNAHNTTIFACDWVQNAPLENCDCLRVKTKSKKKMKYKPIVTASIDETVKIWGIKNDTLPPILKKTLSDITFGIMSVAFNSDGSKFVTSSFNLINIWSTLTGDEIKSITTGFNENRVVIFSPDDQFVTCAGVSAKIFSYSAVSGEKKLAFVCHRPKENNHQKSDMQLESITCIKYNSNGRFLAAGTTTGILYLFDVCIGISIHFISFFEPIRTLCFENLNIIVGLKNGSLEIYPMSTNGKTTTNSRHDSSVQCLDYSIRLNVFASGSADRTIKIWDARQLSCIDTIKLHQDIVWDLKFNLAGDRLISVSEDKSIGFFSACDDSD